MIYDFLINEIDSFLIFFSFFRILNYDSLEHKYQQWYCQRVPVCVSLDTAWTLRCQEWQWCHSFPFSPFINSLKYKIEYIVRLVRPILEFWRVVWIFRKM